MLVLGGGSNVLFAGDYDGLVVRCQFREIEVLRLAGGQVEVIAGAGLAWDHLVGYCVDRGWSGIENLSLIPGSVGGAPIQNIGAYGVEFSCCFAWLEALDLQTGRLKRMESRDCRFAYRDSRFKADWRDRFLILRVAVRLGPTEPVFDYPSLREELALGDVNRPTCAMVRSAVIAIRNRRLPNPALVGNAGSFFKNPVVDTERLETLLSADRDLPAFALSEGGYRVPAGWLVENCGWKGVSRGGAGVSSTHAIVLINRGGAEGREILALAAEIEASVQARFGIQLEREVRVIH